MVCEMVLRDLFLARWSARWYCGILVYYEMVCEMVLRVGEMVFRDGVCLQDGFGDGIFWLNGLRDGISPCDIPKS